MLRDTLQRLGPEQPVNLDAAVQVPAQHVLLASHTCLQRCDDVCKLYRSRRLVHSEPIACSGPTDKWR